MPDFPETRYSLIARLQNLGDGASWAEFLGIYQPVVFRMARRRGLQDADALDVLQQVFLSISRSIETWQPDETQPPFRAWLTTIARHAITKALVRRPPDRPAGTAAAWDALQNLPDEAETTAELVAETRRQIVHWAAEQVRSEFSPATWQAFWQTAVEGQPIEDVAAAIGRSVGAVYVARHRVMARLKARSLEIAAHWDTDNPPTAGTLL